jgi:hypothetical protein
MQDDVVFLRIGVKGNEFWARVNALKAVQTYDDELAWIRMLLDIPAFRALSNADLGRMGGDLRLYPGVPEVFQDLGRLLDRDDYRRHGVVLEHYIVTSGLGAILQGSVLSDHVERIFGCELDEDGNGRVFWPKRVISHTGKTQYLFRISKGLEYVDLTRDVNDHMPEEERRIPFRNMLYIGDGPTDVPCFAVTTSRGGRALAVYDPESRESFETCMSLREAQRVDMIAAADYRRNSELRWLMERYLQQMADNIVAVQQREHEERVIQAPRHG